MMLGYSIAEDTVDGHSHIKYDFSVFKRKRTIAPLRFDQVLDNIAAGKTKEKAFELRKAIT